MRVPALLTVFLAAALNAAGAEWLRLRTPHIELLTDAANAPAYSLLRQLEVFRRAIEAQPILPAGKDPQPLRIVAFASRAEYAAYRLNDTADAFNAGTPAGDYIIMVLQGPKDHFATAAHEYIHSITRHDAPRLPAWLSEGVSEVFSTVRMASGRALFGAPNPDRLQTLRAAPWRPLETLIAFDPSQPHTNGERDMFYAESWALTHMLAFSPKYGPRFHDLLQNGHPVKVYETTLERMGRDLRLWIGNRSLPSITVSVDDLRPPSPVEEHLSRSEAGLALAQLDLALGRRQRAKTAFVALASALPQNPDVPAALARIELLDGDRSEARRQFSRALHLGIADARACYEYAVLAGDANLPDTDIMPALQRALEIDSSLDDARYLLALALKREGRYREALQEFQAVRNVPERRAFAYYTAMAHTQLELGLNDDAAKSAAEAGRHARLDDQVGEAATLAWFARSELVTQVTPDGSARFTRIPRRAPGTADDWNPFIQPGDRIERLEGELRQVDCEGEIRLIVWTGERPLVLAMADPGRVQVLHGGSEPFEFTCGKQEGRRVAVEYAVSPRNNVAGVVRGIGFLQ